METRVSSKAMRMTVVQYMIGTRTQRAVCGCRRSPSDWLAVTPAIGQDKANTKWCWSSAYELYSNTRSQGLSPPFEKVLEEV